MIKTASLPVFPYFREKQGAINQRKNGTLNLEKVTRLTLTATMNLLLDINV